MNKRGLIVTGIGAALIVASFMVVFALFFNLDPVFDGEMFASDLLDEMFDSVTHESVIYPGGSTSFEYSGRAAGVPLLWGVQIVDFDDGDSIVVTTRGSSGGDLYAVQTADPVVFDMFVMDDAGSYVFEVENKGDRPIGVVMMFAEDPDASDLLSDSDSPVLHMLLPLAVSGLVLMAGIATLIAGAVLVIYDWKKEKSRSSYY